MTNGNTVNICSINWTKFLGKTIGVSFLAAHMLASNNTKQQALSVLMIVPLEEYKVWILKNFVTSVLYFHTAVERLSLMFVQST